MFKQLCNEDNHSDSDMTNLLFIDMTESNINLNKNILTLKKYFDLMRLDILESGK